MIIPFQLVYPRCTGRDFLKIKYAVVIKYNTGFNLIDGGPGHIYLLHGFVH